MLKVLSFRIQGDLLGVEINHVKEINRNVEFTIVPKAPDTVVGLFNMRGQIVTLHNLAKILGYETKEKKGKAICIILKSAPDNPNQKGFLIDQTGDVIDIEEDICEMPPANVDEDKYQFVKKVARLDNDLLMILELDKIFKEEIKLK